MKNAFTLIEIIAVIILMGVIGLIVTPIITNTIEDNTEKLYRAQLNDIENNTEKWSYQNNTLLPNKENESITITLLELKKAGLIALNFKNVKTKELFPNDMVINITLKNNKYIAKVDGNSGSNVENDFNQNAPSIVLNGNNLEYLEINSIYQELGAKAIDKDGKAVTVNTQYKLNDTEIPNISATEFKTFSVIYSATSNNNTSYIVRTIIVRDTLAPSLVIPDDAEILVANAFTFDLLAGVTAVDNSLETIKVSTSGYNNLPGKKIVSYTACDSRNNCITKKRIITLVKEIIVEPTVNSIVSNVSNMCTKKGNKCDIATLKSGVSLKVKVREGLVYNFYVLEDNGTELKLLLEHSLGINGRWVSTADDVVWDTSGSMSNGPKNPLSNLDVWTNDWVNIEKRTYTIVDDESGWYNSFDISARAILPNNTQLKLLGCSNLEGSCPSWIYNYMSETKNSVSGHSNFWLSTAYSPSPGNNSAYIINNIGIFKSLGVYQSAGIRPVITVSKTLIP